MKNIKIKNKSGDILNIDLRYDENLKKKLPLLVFCHGFKGFKDWGCFPYMMEKISREGVFVVSFNFSFNGTDNSKDNPVDFDRLDLFAQNTFSKELDDLGNLLDYLEKEKENYNFDFDNLILAGHSRGGGIAILKTAEDMRIKKLIALASVSEFDRYGNETRKNWKERGFIEALNTRTKQKMRMNVTLLEDIENNYERLDICGAMKKIKVPVLIMQGTEDLAVDTSEAETLYNLCDKEKSKLVIMEKTGHTFGGAHPFAGTTDAIERVIGEAVGFINN
ncbi:MAG: prolyl oligopeptidase family serine peptidase [Ignavibacteria bacterium]|nr:prolyl oligopeptidase family serine peptidase [Ignavibacteria bacterium]